MNPDYHVIKGLGTGWGQLRLGTRSRLYQGKDHLLVVMSSGYTEEYRRVAYRNVRYVVVRRTHGRERQAMLSGLIILLLALLIFAHTPLLVLAFLELPFAIWFIVNLVRGESCRTYINTDIQTVELPVPRRVNKVPVLINFLSEKTAAAAPSVAAVI
jgi:hypothetical protein